MRRSYFQMMEGIVELVPAERFSERIFDIVDVPAPRCRKNSSWTNNDKWSQQTTHGSLMRSFHYLLQEIICPPPFREVMDLVSATLTSFRHHTTFHDIPLVEGSR